MSASALMFCLKNQTNAHATIFSLFCLVFACGGERSAVFVGIVVVILFEAQKCFSFFASGDIIRKVFGGFCAWNAVNRALVLKVLRTPSRSV